MSDPHLDKLDRDVSIASCFRHSSDVKKNWFLSQCLSFTWTLIFSRWCEWLDSHHSSLLLTLPTMIARRNVLQVAVAAALTAYILCTLLVRKFGNISWSTSLPDLSRNYMADSVFEHIQNNTLGVRYCPLSYRLNCWLEHWFLVWTYLCHQYERADRQARFPNSSSLGIGVQCGMARRSATGWSTSQGHAWCTIFSSIIPI